MLCRRCRRLAQRVVHEPALHLRAAPPFKTQPHAWRCSSTLAPSAQPRSLADWANVYATLSKFKLRCAPHGAGVQLGSALFLYAWHLQLASLCAPVALLSPPRAPASPSAAATTSRGTDLLGQQQAHGEPRLVRIRSTRHVQRGSCWWSRINHGHLTGPASTQVIETENDARMKRTLRRPLPAGLLSRRHALVFAAGSGLAGVLSLYFQARLF